MVWYTAQHRSLQSILWLEPRGRKPSPFQTRVSPNLRSRVEAAAVPSVTQKRGHLYPDDIVAMTYDRLQPNANSDQLICMKVDSKGTFKTLSVPATLKWRPILAEDRAQITCIEAAIEANPYISSKRKQFLIRRLPYWNSWAKREPRGIINSRDEE